MKNRDSISMAMGNLRNQFWRNALNILGVFIGCLLLFVVLSVTRGATNAIQQVINETADMRRIGFTPDFDPSFPVPKEVSRVQGSMSAARRARIEKRLKQKWRSDYLGKEPMDESKLEAIRALPNIVEVIPEVELNCEIQIKDNSIAGVSAGISISDQQIHERIIAGGPLKLDEPSGVLIHEFIAYQLGWQDDSDLQELIGRQITLRHQLSGRQLSRVLSYLGGADRNMDVAERVNILSTIKQLIDQMDATKLTEEQKQLIRDTLKMDVTNSNNEKALVSERVFTIKGVLRDSEDNDPFHLIRVVTGDYPDVYIPHQIIAELYFQDKSNNGFYSGRAQVNSYKNLAQAEKAMKGLGLHVWSASWLVQDIDEQIEKGGQIAAIIAAIIFLITAIGIANSMTISALQRSREFGIMKSLGARDSGIMRMMLLEGGLIGLAGATIALVFAMVSSLLIVGFLRNRFLPYIDKDSVPNFVDFSVLDVSLVTGLAVIVCMLAAALPARRAARLDPVEAMRR